MKFIFIPRNIFIILIVAFIPLLHVNGQGRILTNPDTKLQIKRGIDDIYNFEFDKSRVVLDSLKEHNPEHPFLFLYEAISVYWEDFPVTPEAEAGDKFELLLKTSVSKTSQILKDDPDNEEIIFLNLVGRLLLMQFYADNDMPSSTIEHIGPAYRQLISGRNKIDQLSEFYFPTGIYNYYREAYPEYHPVYRPFVVFIPSGDKELGLEQLVTGWEKAVFVAAESMSFLSYIQINFEKDYVNGEISTTKLINAYPANPLFVCYHLNMLLMQHKFAQAKPFIEQLEKLASGKEYFLMMANIYNAILLEHAEHQFGQAARLYKMAYEQSKTFGDFASSPRSYALYGLSRISLHNGQNRNARQLRKLADSESSYEHVNFD